MGRSRGENCGGNGTENVVTIVMPLPCAKLHAHAKGRWQGKFVAVRQFRALARLLTTAATRSRWTRATINYHFRWPDNRRRDEVNALQSMKPAIDGIVDAKLIPDDCLQILKLGHVTHEVNKANPGVSLTLLRVIDDEV